MIFKVSDRKFVATSAGFTFIELLVALVIIGVAVAGLVTLQKTFMQGSERAAERTVALQVMQDQIDSFRFQSFEALASGNDTVQRDGSSYTLSWIMRPFYMVGNNWLTTGNNGLPNPLPANPDAKSILITASWTARGGASESIEIDTWFSSIHARDGGLVVTTPPTRAEPKVTYTPGLAPEVIALRLTDDAYANEYLVKETTRPIPRMMKRGDNLQVAFDTVTYNQLTQTQRIEDFVTVNCNCRFGAMNDQGARPHRLTLINGQLQLDPSAGGVKRKTGGVVADNNQPALCTQCCANHHDDNDMVAAGDVYRTESVRTGSGNHRHYRPVTSYLGQLILGDYTVASGSEEYLESCRLRRIDGYYEMYADWQLKAVLVMTDSYLTNSATAATYTNYVRDVIRASILGESLPAAPNDRDVTVLPGSYQLIARGIYLDSMSADNLQEVRDAIAADRPDWISMVPFYEVNLTLLANWASSSTTVATVTSEAIKDVNEDNPDYYATFSRGRVLAKTNGSAEITISAAQGNGSAIGRAAVHPDDAPPLYSSMIVRVDSTSTPPPGGGDDDPPPVIDPDVPRPYSITGEIVCFKKNGRPCNNAGEYGNVAITTNNPAVVCSYTRLSSNSTGTYACNGLAAGTNVIIQFAKAGAQFTPVSLTINNLSQSIEQEVVMQLQ